MILNLSNPPASIIKAKIGKYPDGQQYVIIDPQFTVGENGITIYSRFNSFLDLELIVTATKALQNLDVKKINLYVPYILGARSDRKFEYGGTSYLVQIIAPILNSLGLTKVYCLDVHNQAVAEACINNLVCYDNSEFIKRVLGDIQSKNLVIVTPDDGASKKIYPLCKKLGLEVPVVVCAKHRDIKTGKIEGVDIPHGTHFKNEEVMLIDDICDGGRTFIEIAKKLKTWGEPAKMYLAVTHGIFSAGFDELHQYFDQIFSTNSVKDHPNISVTQYPVI
jgi:ribose-phosphate pyrophosphokinase